MSPAIMFLCVFDFYPFHFELEISNFNIPDQNSCFDQFNTNNVLSIIYPSASDSTFTALLKTIQLLGTV